MSYSILVTGGTGSFGRKYVAWASGQGHAVRVFSRDEQKQAAMARDYPGGRVRFLLGDVRDRGRIRRAVDGCDLVVHAAALKMIDLGEYNPGEVVATNVEGTRNVVDACLDAKVARTVVLSSDKAVHPANLYGATKMVAERLAIQSNSYAGGSGCRIACVRYGNVMASRGSVFELYERLAAEGKPLPVTDLTMTRFWLTLDQAVALVNLAAREMQGGEIFVPKIPSASVATIVETFGGGPTTVTGIRPGEKMHESLISIDEARNTTEFSNCFVIWPDRPQWKNIIRVGHPVPNNFFLSSDHNNGHFLQPQDVRRMYEDTQAPNSRRDRQQPQRVRDTTTRAH